MPKTMLICKACGKEYEACRTPNPGIFRWRDVACSLECATKYIHDVMVARGEITEESAEPEVNTNSINEVNDGAEKTEAETVATEVPSETKVVKAGRKKKQ